MDRRLLLALAFVPVAFYAWACGGDDEQPPPDPGPSSSSGAGSSGETSSSGNTSSSGGQADSGDPDTGASVCPGNPLSEDAGSGDGGAVVSSDAGTVKLIVTTAANFLDGPHFTDLFDGGALVYSEVFSQRIMRVAPTGGTGVEIRTAPGAPEALLPIGNAQGAGTILTVVAYPDDTPNTSGQTPGILTTFADGGPGPKIDVPNTINNPNDLVVGQGGIIFFTDPAYQSGNVNRGAYRVNPDGGVDTVKSYPGEAPDGIALSPDGTILYVAMGGTGKRIDRFTVGANGATAVANPATLQAQYTDDLEGLAVDTAGNVWVAESARATDLNNPPNGGRVEVFAPDGKKHGEIVFPAHRPISVAFGGTDNKTVYIVANRNANAGGGGQADYSGYVFTFTTRCAGLR
jgi:gluconolactonase